jgi:hypothetical protein
MLGDRLNPRWDMMIARDRIDSANVDARERAGRLSGGQLVGPEPGTVVTFGPCSTSVPALHDNTRFGSMALLLGLV